MKAGFIVAMILCYVSVALSFFSLGRSTATRFSSEAQFDSIMDCLKRIQTIQAARHRPIMTGKGMPVMRCKECKWFGSIGCAIKDNFVDYPTEDDFCSLGQREEQA